VVEVKPPTSPRRRPRTLNLRSRKSKEPVAVPVENKEKKVKSDKTEKTAGKGKKTK
jgi:hypothetical protein